MEWNSQSVRRVVRSRSRAGGPRAPAGRGPAAGARPGGRGPPAGRLGRGAGAAAGGAGPRGAGRGLSSGTWCTARTAAHSPRSGSAESQAGSKRRELGTSSAGELLTLPESPEVATTTISNIILLSLLLYLHSIV